MSKLGPRLVKSIQEALDGNFASVTMDGKRWVRLPDGYVVVPKEPTEAMLIVGHCTTASDHLEEAYIAMVKAAQE